MTNRAAFLCLVVLLLPACGQFMEEDTKLMPADPAAVDAVLEALLVRLGTEFEEEGVEFVKRIPVVKDEVAVANGFESWKQFLDRVRLLDPERDLFIARRTTARIEELLEVPMETSEDGKSPEENE